MLKAAARSQDAFSQTGALSALVNLHRFIDDDTFLTKTGDLGVVLAVEGVDDECLDADVRDGIARRFEAALRMFDEQTRLLQYVIKRPRVPDRSRPHANPRIQALLDRQHQFASDATRKVFGVAVYWVVVVSPAHDGAATAGQARQLLRAPVTSVRHWLSHPCAVTALDAQMTRQHQILHDQVRAFVVQLEDVVHPTLLSKRRAFRFFRRLLNYDPIKADAIELREDTFLDYHACDSALECHRGYLRLDDFYVRVLTLREPPAQTFAHVLRGLAEIPEGLVLMSEWRRVDAGAMRRRLRAMQRHFHNARIRLTHYLGDAPTATGEALVDDSASALVKDLGACLTDLTLHGRFVGSYSLTLVLYDHDPARLAEQVAAAVKACAAHDGQLTDERANLLNAWLAVLPGNAAYNLRTLYLLNTNAADLACLFAPDPGSPINHHLSEDSLAVLESTTQTPYHLNLHVDDVAHTLVLGATGSGKSFLLNFLVARLQQYAPQTTIFDLGGSYERLTQYFGGSVLRVGRDRRTFTINPFCLPPAPTNRQFLWRFLKVLIQSGGQYAMTEADDRDLYEQIETLYALDADQRRLFTLATILKRPLAQHLQRWVQGGQYADVFDHVEDTVTFARFQYVDFEGWDTVPQVLEPLLFYLLHRADAAMGDSDGAGGFKVFVLDEAWRFFRDAAIRAYVTEALKTWRKRNACVLLATQSSEDLVRSELVRVVVESCPTVCFLANPQIDRAAFRELFHLTETEAERIATLVHRRQFLLKQPGVAKVLEVEVDSESARLFGSARAGGSPLSTEGADA